MLLITYAVFSVILLILFFSLLRGDIANLFKRPVCLAILFLTVIHGITPAIQYSQSIYRYIDVGQTYSAFSHMYSIILVMVFTAAMLICYYMLPKTNEHLMPQLNPMPGYGKFYLVVCLVLPAAYGIIAYTWRIISFGYENYMQDRIGFSDRYGGFALLFCPWIYVAFLVCFAAFFASYKRDKMIFIWALILGAITMVHSGYLGNRNPIFICVFSCIGIYFTAVQAPRFSIIKLLFSKIGVSLICLLIGMIFVGYLRETKVGVVSSAGRAAAVTLNSAFGNHENILWLVDNKFEFQYGKTYLAGFVNLYPRAFWPGKPVGAGPILKNFVDPGSYEIGKKGVSSLTTGSITEAYMNFGFTGVAIMGAATGIVLYLLTLLRLKCSGGWTLAMYCYTIFTFSASMMHNEFSGAYTRWITDVFPMFIGYILCELKKPGEPVYYMDDLQNPDENF